jgi:heme exporter protein B
MSVLALPLVLPSVLLLLKVTAVSIRLINDTAVGEDIWMLAGVDLLLTGVMVWLFPVLWRS